MCKFRRLDEVCARHKNRTSFVFADRNMIISRNLAEQLPRNFCWDMPHHHALFNFSRESVNVATTIFFFLVKVATTIASLLIKLVRLSKN